MAQIIHKSMEVLGGRLARRVEQILMPVFPINQPNQEFLLTAALTGSSATMGKGTMTLMDVKAIVKELQELVGIKHRIYLHGYTHMHTYAHALT
jgi:hypothetical protein